MESQIAPWGEANCQRRLFRDLRAPGAIVGPAAARFVAITSLLLWTGATVTGRLMGYLGPVSGLE